MAASFAHGANDVANSVGPFAAIYAIYDTGRVDDKSNISEWILVRVRALYMRSLCEQDQRPLCATKRKHAIYTFYRHCSLGISSC